MNEKGNDERVRAAEPCLKPDAGLLTNAFAAIKGLWDS
jgi:hypothetical protein